MTHDLQLLTKLVKGCYNYQMAGFPNPELDANRLITEKMYAESKHNIGVLLKLLI